ncbi:MAG: hypothetical protein IH865_07765 [Chloroflexi bacterium]|nr:hypothetical protein [Chloroflexota bacterium]
MLSSEARAHVIPERAAGHVWLGSLGSVLVAYLLLTIAAAVWLPVPEIARAALALPALALIPLLVGSALLRLLPVLDQTSALDGFGRALIEWLVGSLALAVLAVVLQLGGQAFLLQRVGLIALVMAAGGSIAWHARGWRPVHLPAAGPITLALAIVILLSIAPKGIVARYAEFPLLTGNVADVALHFTQPALRMLEQGYLELQNPSHGPALVTLIAILSQLYDVNPLSVIWMGPFLLFTVYGVGLFLWANAVSGRSTTAVLVTAIGVFLPVEPIFYSASPLVLRSNTILFALFPLGLYLMHRLVVADDAPKRAKAEALIALQGSIGVLFIAMNAYRLGLFSQEVRVLLMLVVAGALGIAFAAANRRRWRWTGLPALFLVIVGFQVFHIYESPVFLTALIVYGVALTMRGLRVDRFVAAGLCLAVGGFFFLQFSGILSFPQDFSISSAVFGSTYENFSPDFAGQVDLLKLTLSPPVLVLMLLGVAGFLARKHEAGGRAVVMAAAVMFVFYFMPDPFAFRINKSFAPFLAFLIVAGAFNTGTLVSGLVRRSGSAPVLFRSVAQLAMIAAVLPSLVVPFLESASTPARVALYPQVADVEYELASWFQDQTGENARIVSDSQTMLLLTSLGNKVSIAERKFLLDEMSADGREQMTFIKDSVLGAPTGCAAYAGIRALAGTEPVPERRYLEAIGAQSQEPDYFVVWTAKTFLWTTRPERIDPVLSPVTEDTMPWWREGMEPFRDTGFFRPVAQIGSEAYVFAALPAADVSPGELTSCSSATTELIRTR